MKPRALALAALTACGVIFCICLSAAAIDRLYARIEDGGDWLAPAVTVVLLAITLMLQFRLFVLLGLAVARLTALSRLKVAEDREWPGVTVIMPAYNEQRNLENGLRSLAELDYPELEVIVVDDGSRDRTAEIAREVAASSTGAVIRVITKPNGGKWAALNLGLREARHSLVLCVDADSRISRNALRTLVPYLDEPDVGAACGQVRVRNRGSAVERLQAVEYLLAGFVRASQHDCIMVVPGPIGLFRKDALADMAQFFGTPGFDEDNPGHCAGPFAADTFAEDFDVTLSLLTLGWRTVWDPRAIAFTRAPDNFSELLNQRYRWVRGTIQAILKRPWRQTRGLRKPHPWLLPWITTILAPDLFVMPAIAMMNLFMFVLSLAGAIDFPWGVPLSMMTVDVVITLLAIDIHEDDWRLIPSVLGFGFFCTFLNVNWLPVVWDQVRGSKMRW